MNLKKKIVAGILTGAFVIGSGFISTSTEAAEVKDNHNAIAHHLLKDGAKPQKPKNKEEAVERLATVSKLDKAKVKSLLDNGYHPRDIKYAGKFANKTKKSVDEILAMKKINNKWKDVAKSLGISIDEKDIKPQRKHRKPHRPNHLEYSESSK